MTDDYKQFIGKRVIITLSNQMRFTGEIYSIGQDYIKLKDKFLKDVFIPIANVCSIEVER